MSAGLLGDSLLYISVRPQLLFEVIVDDATPAEPFWDKCSDSSDPIPTYVLGGRTVQRFQILRQVAAILVRARCAALYAARSDRLVGYAIILKIDLSSSHLLCAWDAIVSHT